MTTFSFYLVSFVRLTTMMKRKNLDFLIESIDRGGWGRRRKSEKVFRIDLWKDLNPLESHQQQLLKGEWAGAWGASNDCRNFRSSFTSAFRPCVLASHEKHKKKTFRKNIWRWKVFLIFDRIHELHHERRPRVSESEPDSRSLRDVSSAEVYVNTMHSVASCGARVLAKLESHFQNVLKLLSKLNSWAQIINVKSIGTENLI